MWHKWILAPLWIAHIAILMRPVTVLLVFISMKPTGILWWLRSSQAYYFGFVISLVLELSEIKFFRSHQLSPFFYLASQCYKSSLLSYGLYTSCIEGRHFRRRAILSSSFVETFTFYVGLLYALYVLLQQRRLRWKSARTTSRLRNVDNDPEQKSATFSVPLQINTSLNIRTDRAVLVQLLQWINKDPPYSKTLPQSMQYSYEWLVFILKCIASYVPIVLVLPLSSRIPGEPKPVYSDQARTWLDDWEYPRPSVRRGDPQDVDTEELSSTAIRDEE